MIKNYNIKKYSLIVLQALSAVLVSACICIYSFYSRVQVRFSPDEVSVEKLSLLDFKANYYDSDNYSYNLLATVDDIARYSVIKSQLETDGKYDPDKIIFISEYTHRADSEPYNGPDAAYYLKDLIAWGQFGISTNGISHSYKVFDSWEEFNSFFGQNEVNKKGGFNAVESTITYEITSEEGIGIQILHYI